MKALHPESSLFWLRKCVRSSRETHSLYLQVSAKFLSARNLSSSVRVCVGCLSHSLRVCISTPKYIEKNAPTSYGQGINYIRSL